MSSEYWDQVVRTMEGRYHLDPIMAIHKKRVHLDLLRSWCRNEPGARILKTDLFEEAIGNDEILLTWPDGAADLRIYGMDLSWEVGRRARGRIRRAGRTAAVVMGDARVLPYRDGSFDFVFSCSTLDHFSQSDDLLLGLRESFRVMKSGGEMILLLDNPQSLFYPLVRWLDRRGMIGFRLGETFSSSRLRVELAGIGLDIIDCRAVYHLPRVVLTALLKIVRALRITFADSLILRSLAALEKWQGKPGQYWSGWYTALHLRKGAGLSGKGVRGRS